MPTTARGLWYPDTSSPANPISLGTTAATSQQAALDALALGEAVPRFASAAARDAAYTAAGVTVVNGMHCAILGVPFVFGPTSGNATAHWWPMNNLGLLVSADHAASVTAVDQAVVSVSGYTGSTSFTLTEPRLIGLFMRFNIFDSFANRLVRFTNTWVSTFDLHWQDTTDASGRTVSVAGSPTIANAGTYNVTSTFSRPGAGNAGTCTVNAVNLRVYDLGAV